MIAELFTLMLGGPSPSPEAVRIFLEGSGLAAGEREQFAGVRPFEHVSEDKVAAALTHFSVPALRQLVNSSSYRDLCRSRTATRKIFSLINAFAPVVKQLSRTRDAAGFDEMTRLDVESQLPMLILAVRIFEERGYGVKRITRLAEQWTHIYRAGYVVIRAFPLPHRRFLAPGGMDDLKRRTQTTKIDFLRARERAIKAHPDEVAVMAGAPHSDE